ncbi:MAG: YraN family protein [candidate division WOR-3 bacterium]|nr:YraN family protein [candidate division WOR-3 bacterium]
MKKLGQVGEELAVKYLKSIGLKILAQNYRCHLGEIDIIAQDKNTIVFVEVKTRKSNLIVQPFESVGYKKQMKIKSLAEYYLQENNILNYEARFDVLSIVKKNNETLIEYLPNAF